jgi:hypothetical protein
LSRQFNPSIPTLYYKLALLRQYDSMFIYHHLQAFLRVSVRCSVYNFLFLKWISFVQYFIQLLFVLLNKFDKRLFTIENFK